MLNLTKFEEIPNTTSVEDQFLLHELLTMPLAELASLGDRLIEDRASSIVNHFVLPVLIRQAEDFCELQHNHGIYGAAPPRSVEALRLINEAKELHILVEGCYPLVNEIERIVPRGVVIHTLVGPMIYPAV